MHRALVLAERPLLSKKEERALAAAGVKVATYSTFHKTLVNNGHGDYDIIVLDDSLRNADLYETCHQLRDASKAFIILLGSMPSWEMWEKSQEIGFDRYYKKPLQPRELGSKIKIAAYEMGYQNNPKPQECDDGGTTGEVAPEEPIKLEAAQPEPVRVPENPAPVPCSAPPPPEAPPDSAANIWQDPKVTGIMSSLLIGKNTQLCPQIDLSLTDGFSYREADAITGTTGKETALILESLAKEGLLVKQDYDRILVSPTGSTQLVPMERCPQCDATELTRGQLIEHFSCGHIGLEDEFTQGLKLFCPKCKKELRLIGTDFRKPGMRYVCKKCRGVFPAPAIKCRCLKTGEVYALQELRHLRLYSYRLNETQRKRLEFELEPKRQLIDCLVHLGYDVQEAVQVQGRSGATHTIDLIASIDDLLTRHTVAIGILAAPQGTSEVSLETLFGFDSKVYDASIDSKMVIAVPRFSSEAMKFAERQGIRMYRLEDLKVLLGGKIHEMEIIAVNKETATDSPGRIDMTKLGPTNWLKWLLEKRGYQVTEKLKLAGRSGAEHVLDIYAEKDDGIVNHKLAACVIKEESVANDVNEVIKFDAAAYDAHIRDKIIISVPRLSKEARQFAEYQRIKVLEARELADFHGQYEADDVARRFSNLLSNS